MDATYPSRHAGFVQIAITNTNRQLRKIINADLWSILSPALR
jgi:hypothetical protein